MGFIYINTCSIIDYFCGKFNANTIQITLEHQLKKRTQWATLHLLKFS
jgi:hypothetical protein